MIKPKSLQQRLSLYLILPVALILLVMGFAGFIYARNILLSQWQEASILKLQRAAHQVDMRLERVKDWIRIFDLAASKPDIAEIFRLVEEQLKLQESVDHVHLRWSNGAGPAVDFDKHRMSAMKHMGDGQPMMMRRFHHARFREITPPRFDEARDHETVSLISDLKDQDDRSIGRLEVVLDFGRLIKNIRESGWWQSNKAYLVDDGGKILTSAAYEKRGSLAESGNTLEAKTMKALKSSSFGTILGEGHPPREVSGFYKLQGAPWSLVMIAPGKAILSPLVRFRFHYFAIGAGFIVLIVILIKVITGQTVASIREVSSAARRVAEGEYGSVLPVKSRDEVGELIRSFNAMVRQLRERLKMKEAMNLAMEVQQNLLPRKMPEIEGLDIAARSIYCDETGGDLYDFLKVDGQTADCIGIAVGDVSGHGIPSALLMATVRAFMKSRVSQTGSPAEIITDINRLITNDTGDTGQFMTLFYAVVDAGRKELRWVRAGHDPAVYYEPAKDCFQELGGEGMALGVDGEYTYRESGCIALTAGQIVLIGTDGLWETHNEAGEMFGKARLEAIIRRKVSKPAGAILRSIVQAVQEFRGSAKQDDDITLVVIKIVDH